GSLGGNTHAGGKDIFLVKISTIPEPSPFSLDIKPGSWPNSVNPKSKGVLPVAVPGTETFDVTEIDPSTVMLSIEGDDDTLSPLRWAYEDVATPFVGELGEGHDLDGDGFDDLTLKFNMQELVEAFGLGDLTDEMVAFTIYGELTDGTAFEGIDWIRMPGNGNGNALQWQSLSGQPAMSVTAVPEPTTLALLCMGVVGFLLHVRRGR
ncbi:MAG: PEP-CTERM sorting domain-containing protein, partial [Thermoguttaceae bacterium]